MKTKEEILAINQQQKEFYNHKKKNLATRLWSQLRGGLLSDIRKTTGVQKQTYEKHKEWLGDLSKKKVLDLGCFSGNHLSVWIAEHAKEYVAIDLSDVGISKLQEKIKHCPNAKALAVDFLSDEQFPDTHFDVIYAYGVLHHFQNVSLLIERIKEKLTPEGTIISYDPLETSLPLKIMRSLYRPFQSDKDWEWPFTQKTYKQFASNFTILEKRAVLGKLKWFFLVNLLPLSQSKKTEIGKKWHTLDWEQSNTSDTYLYQCMHLTLFMKNKCVNSKF